MKKFYSLSLSASLLTLLLAFTGCSDKNDPDPEISLELTVVNESGKPIEGAIATLYNTKDGWAKEVPVDVVASGETNVNGKFTFLGDLETKAYYISVTHGTNTILTNWGEAVNTIAPLQRNVNNSLHVVINETPIGYLAGGGKLWKLEKLYIGEDDYTSQLEECFLNDETFIFKDFSYSYDEGATKCDSNKPQVETGVFTINESSFTITDDQGNETTGILKINSVNQMEMIDVPQFGAGSRLVYTAVYY